jgi:CHAT domain-containing protein
MCGAKSAVLLGLLVCLSFHVAISSTRDQNPLSELPLVLAQPRAAEIKSDSSHSYPLTLAAGECVRVELQSDKARLSLTLLSAKNELLATISESDAPQVKRLDIVAEHTTTYLLRVTPERSQQTTAQYRLTLQDKHPATAQDRERFGLHQLDTEVVRLYRQQEKSALQQAADKGREAGARWLALNEPERAGRMLQRAGRSLFLVGQYQSAVVVYQQTITAFQQAGAKAAEAMSWAHLAVLGYVKGDFSLMFMGYARAGVLWQATRDEEGLRFGRLLQAYLHLGAGDHQQAEPLCRQLLADVSTGRTDEWDRLFREDVLLVLSEVLLRQGEPRKALAYLEEALSLARQSRNALIEGLILHHTAWAWEALQEPQKAIPYCQEAGALWETVGWGLGQGEIHFKLGYLYLQLGRKAEARQAYQRSLAVADDASTQQLSNALIALAHLQHDKGELTEALASAEQARRILEGLVSQVPVDGLRASFHGRAHEAHELRTDLLMHLHERQPAAGYDVAAFQASETARARALLQLLREKQVLPPESLDPALMKQADGLRQRLAALTSEQVRLRADAQSSHRATLAATQSALLAELENVMIQLRERHPRTALVTMPASLTLGEIQHQVLDRDTLLLAYELGTERSFLFAVTPTALHTFRLPPRSVIEEAARQVHETLSRRQQPVSFASLADKQIWLRRNERAYEQAAALLSTLLLAPAAALLPQKRLLIVPDGALHYVPFAALPVVSGQSSVTKNNGQRTTNNGQPLIVKHEILTLPSASTLALLRREWQGRPTAEKQLAVFADPVFGPQDERVAAASPVHTAQATEQLRALGFVKENGEAVIPRLPASRLEAEGILALLPPAEQQIALGFEASYQRVKQADLSQYRYVHFATHGLLDENHPELSGLLFSQVNRQGGNEAGFFTALDAFQLKLNAELVTLSGCRTALGKEVSGEGLIGLTRGFLYAGARRVAASLWQVHDVATAELMQRFYQGMLGRRKLAPAAALRAAQIEMWRNQRWQSPYYWAAFTLQGEW